MPWLPKMPKGNTTKLSTRRIWTKNLFDGIRRAMPSFSTDLLLSNVMSNRVAWVFEEVGYDFTKVLPYVASSALRHNGENGLAVRDEFGSVLILKVNYCSEMMVQGLMKREEAALRDPVLLVHGDGTRISTHSKNEVLQWFPGRIQDFEKARLFTCLENLKNWYSDESIVLYGEFAESILRELIPHSEEDGANLRRDVTLFGE